MSHERMNLPSSAYPVEHRTLHAPPLAEIATVLNEALSKNYAEASCTVGACADLTQPPFGLVRPGLSGGKQAILDVGGPPYLLPTPMPQHRYDFKLLADQLNVQGHAVIGAGAGPYHQLGRNSEMIANIFIPPAINDTLLKNECRYVTVDNFVDSSSSSAVAGHSVHKFSDLIPVTAEKSKTEFVLLGNFYVSRGDAGQCLCIRAKTRTGTQADFTACIREALKQHYGENKVVGLGGVLAMHAGKARFHVMPDFSREPIRNDRELNNWLNFFEIPAPFMCVSEIVSHDPGLDLRVQHSHGYGVNGGGHYHYDTTPAEVEYEAYYNVATDLYRIDRPKDEDSSNFGRD